MQCYQNIMVGDDTFAPLGRVSNNGVRYDPVRQPRVLALYRMAFGLLIQLGRSQRASAAFRALPYGFDFFDLLQSHRIRYYCDMTRTSGGLFGQTLHHIPNLGAWNWWEVPQPLRPRPSLNDVNAQITVTGERFSQGYRFVAGTLLHELAHVNGASGSDSDQTAERILIPFGLGDIFNQEVFGAATPLSSGRQNVRA